MIEQILARTALVVEERKRERSIEELKARVVPTQRSLAKALKKGRNAVILECKKASPSQGVIRQNFDVAEIIKAYDPFTDAISVLTNAPFFEGDLSYLRQAREHTQKPLLCKDFILSPYQVYEARYFDADAVLLMMSVLNDADFQECFEVANSLSMDALVEVHDEQELERALRLGAQIIGVNNRDFKTLKVDLTTAERLLPKIPDDKIAVFESGLSTHQELRRYAEIADAFLVGTALMKQENLPRAVRELVFGRVKVCGLTRNEDALAAFNAGAVFGGLIFAPQSPRCISISQAQVVAKGCALGFVGVFVNQPVELISDHVAQLGLCAVQLHGEETREFVLELRKRVPKTCEIWKAVRVRDSIPSLDAFECDRILLDAYDPTRHGGTGQQFSWEYLKDLVHKEHYILSGGLSPQNAKQADAKALWALDVNSGVEASPGIKNAELVRAFFEELR